MRKPFASILIVIFFLALCFSFSCLALNLDGKMDENIWKQLTPQVLVSASDISNCGVEFATVCYSVDESNNIIYFGFKMMYSACSGESSTPGVALSIDGSSFVSFTSADCSGADTDKYNFKGGVFEMSPTSSSAELLLGVKHGLPPTCSIAVRFIDADGISSNVYSFTVETNFTPTTLQTTKASQTYTERITSTKKATTSKAVKTTTEKTTKAKTTKIKTTKPKLTKAKTTKAAGTAHKLTTAQKTKNETAVATAENIVEPNTTQSVETTTLNSRQLKVQKGFSYAGVAALLVSAFGVCVAVNMSHDKKDETN